MANKTSNVILRVAPRERTQWRRAAKLDGRTLSDWIRRVCDAAEYAELGEERRRQVYGA